jgi:hypothetical protein
MPKVARYQPDQALTQVVRKPRADPNAANPVFNANSRLLQGAKALSQSVDDLNARIDTTSAREAYTMFQRGMDQLFSQPKTGYFYTQGRNSYDAAKTTSDALRDLQKKHGEGLSPDALRMFTRASQVNITSGLADIARHSAKGLRTWEVTSLGARVENTLEKAVLYQNQPNQLKVQNALGRQAIIDLSEMQGIGTEATNEKLQTYNSTFAENVIRSALSQSSEEGSQAFDVYGGQVEGIGRMNLENAIKKKSQDERNQIEARNVVLTGNRLGSIYSSRKSLIEEVNKIEDIELRKKTLSESMRVFNLKKQAESEARGDAFNRAEEHIFNGGSSSTYQVDDPEGWGKLTSKQKTQIQKGKPVETNFNVYSDLMLLDKESLSKIDPMDHIHELAKPEFKRLVSSIKNARGLGSKSDKIDHQTGRTRNAQIRDTLEAILGRRAWWSNNQRKWASEFYSSVDGEVTRKESQSKQPLSSKEFTDLLNAFTLDMTIRKDFAGFHFDILDDDLRIQDIPASELRELSETLRRNGIPLTSKNLFNAHRQAKDQKIKVLEQTIDNTSSKVDSLSPDEDPRVQDIPSSELRELRELLKRNDIPLTSDNLFNAHRQATSQGEE